MGNTYQPFGGLCFTDTFLSNEHGGVSASGHLPGDEKDVNAGTPRIQVIVGNPPYSVGQGSANDNNQNTDYPQLDGRIAETYSARSKAANRKSLYDSYVRAIRWASDRLGECGIVGFVTNASFIDAASADGLRKCLVEEFSSLYVLHLRGNHRTAGERSRREGGQVFGAGSRAPVAISLLVKNPMAKEKGALYFCDVGDFLTRDEKLKILEGYQSIAGISEAGGWIQITPNEHGDWVRQRDTGFDGHIAMGSKDRSDASARLFEVYSMGVATNRDAWTYGPSKTAVADQIIRMIDFYNAEVARMDATFPGMDKKAREGKVADFIDTDPRRISWTRALHRQLAKGERLAFDETRIVPSLYRPFSKQWLYFDRRLNEMVYQMPRIFPWAGVANRVIGCSGGESRSAYSVLMADVVPSLHAADMVGSQFFPLYQYDAEGWDSDWDGSSQQHPSTENPNVRTARRDGITDAGLAHFRAAYPGEILGKEDVFYYVYGLLHAPDYRERYAHNLGRELPRIPCVLTARDFWAFSKAGRELAELHVGYERVPEYPAVIEGPDRPAAGHYRVKKMKFGKGKDKTVIHYNEFITVRGIPSSVYDYVVNGRSAVEWVMERQIATTDKASGIAKDANEWAITTACDARHPLSLLLRVMTVSLETIRVVESLPKLDGKADEPVDLWLGEGDRGVDDTELC